MGDDNKEIPTQIALHAVNNVLGGPTQFDLFSEQVEDFSEEFGIRLNGRIERFGIDLTEQQSRIMEGILHGLSRTGYRGNIESKSKGEIAKERFGGRIPDSYRYLDFIPRLRVTQSEILQWSGVNTKSIESWGRAVKAIKQLGVKQYCFFYDRLALDEEGNPVKDKKNGGYKKESVVAVDTLFTIKEVREKSGKLKYYEITPSAIFLDQRESYFMMVPNNWREEVRKIYGNKKASAYTFSFLMFLRYQYELKRRNSKERLPYRIRWSAERIAQAIKMPESTYLKRKKRANEILQNAYEVAKRLGYLKSYQRLGHLDVLELNEAKFFDPSNNNKLLGQPKRGESSQIQKFPVNPDVFEIFELFHSCRKKLDDGHEKPDGALLEKDLEIICELLKKRSKEQVKRVIEWSITDSFWSSRLANVRRLFEAFGEAIATLNLKPGSTELLERNRQTAYRAKKMLYSDVEGAHIDVLSKYVEVGNGVHKPDIVEFSDPKFEECFKKVIQRWKFQVKDSSLV